MRAFLAEEKMCQPHDGNIAVGPAGYPMCSALVFWPTRKSLARLVVSSPASLCQARQFMDCLLLPFCPRSRSFSSTVSFIPDCTLAGGVITPISWMGKPRFKSVNETCSQLFETAMFVTISYTGIDNRYRKVIF